MNICASRAVREGSGCRSLASAGKTSRKFAMRRSLRVLSAWTKETLQDHYFKEAKREGYLSRAAYKLKEIQKKHKLIKPGYHVLDLGCSPGAWMQVACQELGPPNFGGAVIGIDIQETSRPARFCDNRVSVMTADVRTLDPNSLVPLAPQGFDTVLSDMLHFTNGINDVDLSVELAQSALNVATGYFYELYGDAYAQRMGFTHAGVLKPGGALVIKIYDGAGVTEFIRDMQKYFTKVSRMRVDASRSMSREFYAIGLGRKRPAKQLLD